MALAVYLWCDDDNKKMEVKHMYIPDPIEILDQQIENQIGLIDKDGLYPCCECNKKYKPGEMYQASRHPAAPLLCQDCASKDDGS